ncbi:DUF7670 domain-containing protein [Carboxylicivirga taeanensis]|uniref:DUF7670 domain-containing protein n=1 Tax=Carboxylicivirga taeanensis TaxID=1416875 RepID=UPI003F6DBAF1
MTRTGDILFWTPRLMCIVAIVVLAMLSFDAFKPEVASWHEVRTFVLQMIPSVTLILLLVIAWRKELTGGLIFIIIGLGLSVIVFYYHHQLGHSFLRSLISFFLIAFPPTLAGFLFVGHYFYKKKHKHTVH